MFERNEYGFYTSQIEATPLLIESTKIVFLHIFSNAFGIDITNSMIHQLEGNLSMEDFVYQVMPSNVKFPRYILPSLDLHSPYRIISVRPNPHKQSCFLSTLHGVNEFPYINTWYLDLHSQKVSKIKSYFTSFY